MWRDGQLLCNSRHDAFHVSLHLWLLQDCCIIPAYAFITRHATAAVTAVNLDVTEMLPRKFRLQRLLQRKQRVQCDSGVR